LCGPLLIRLAERAQRAAAYQAEHVEADAAAERQAWRRALSRAKATVVVEGAADGIPYLWRLLSPV
jgi:hypothetical protein